MRLIPFGDAGLLVEVRGLDEVLALYASLVDDPPAGVVDLVPAARTLLLRLEASADPEDVRRAVTGRRPEPGRRPRGELVRVPVEYDGPDLADVARITGLGVRGVVAAHTEQEWTVAFCGFTPGFGYLVGQDDRLRVPRHPTPRTRVPAGSVGLAGDFAGVYPRASPGGWRLLGRTDLALWDLERDQPALLRPGVRVRFVAA